MKNLQKVEGKMNKKESIKLPDESLGAALNVL